MERIETLRMEGVTRQYGNAAALSAFTLDIAGGTFTTLLGPSGCGKTTALNCLAGLLDLSSGQILLNGRPIHTTPAEKRGFGLVFQNYALFPHLNVERNVGYGLEIRRVPKAERQQRIREALSIVHLEDLGRRYPAQLSGGQQQRLAIARTIVLRPNLLLMDEPLSNLDANLREEMRSEIRRLHDAFRITTVYVTHDQAEAMVTSDRIVVMNHGRIEQVDDPVSLYNRPRTRFVAGFIGRTSFLDGTLDGATIGFPGFAVSADLLPDIGGAAKRVSFSVRPQNIVMHRTAPAPVNGAWLIQGSVAERAYLGECWEYVVRPSATDLRLRVSTAPQDVHETGDAVWLEIDPRRIARVPSEEG